MPLKILIYHDLLAPGGLSVFITTAKFADSKGNQTVRGELLKRADLTFFRRLPTNLFMDSGTKVSADLVIMKKNPDKDKLAAYEQEFAKEIAQSLKERITRLRKLQEQYAGSSAEYEAYSAEIKFLE